jgi:hypothetical protein
MKRVRFATLSSGEGLGVRPRCGVPLLTLMQHQIAYLCAYHVIKPDHQVQ